MTIDITPVTPVNPVTLLDYLTDCQRALHDSTYAFWTQTELIDYINKARRKIAAETGCLRQLLEAVDISTGVGTYDFFSLLAGRQITCVLDIYLNYSGSRVPLFFYPYPQFARSAAVVYNQTSVPRYWSQIGNTVRIAPLPSVDYTADFDVAIDPLKLSATTDQDNEILAPFSDCVMFYVGYLAKIKDQRRDQAEDFLNDFYMNLRQASASGLVRRITGR